MSTRPERVVDPHVHLWDPARTDWYPYLSGRLELDMGDVTGMSRRFDVPTYFAESAGWNVEKLVNVAAATGRHSVDETLAMEERAEVDGHPDAIVGGIPPTDSIDEAVALLDRQRSATRLRGVRPMGQHAAPVPDREVLEAVHERGLLFELMAHADELLVAAAALAEVDGLVVVVEHAGWPRSDTDEERALWQEGLAALAGLGDRVVCKLSGLAMPLGSMGVDAQAPWLEHAIEVFGTDRCMFASNFPVDGMHGTFDQLFAATAERVYRC